MKELDLIWDFNGTLLNDVALCFDCINRLLKKRSLPPVASVEQYRKVFGFPVSEYYRRVGLHFETESFETIAEEWVREYRAREATCGLYHGTQEVLSAFFTAGYRQTVISASEIEMLKTQIGALGIGEFFAEIRGTDHVYAHGKLDVAKQWRDTYPHRKALLIGDTLHDAETAEVMGAECVLIAAGHQSKERLLRANVPVLEDIRMLPAYLECKKHGIP